MLPGARRRLRVHQSKGGLFSRVLPSIHFKIFKFLERVMTATDERKWSYMPIGIFADPDLSPRDLQVMGVICCSTNKHGICYRSQVKIARFLRIGRTTVVRAIQRLMKSGWLERRGGTRRDGGSCSFVYRVVNKDIPTPDQADLFEPNLEEEALLQEEKRYENGQSLSAQTDTYKNELLITIDDEDAAASRANEGKPEVPSHAQVQAAKRFKHYVNEVVATLARLKPGLDVTRMADGANPIVGWFAKGCDLEQDVKPALAIVLERARVVPNSLNYFTKAVLSAMSSRKELSEINPNYKSFGAHAAEKRARELEASRARCNAALDELNAEYAERGAL